MPERNKVDLSSPEAPDQQEGKLLSEPQVDLPKEKPSFMRP